MAVDRCKIPRCRDQVAVILIDLALCDRHWRAVCDARDKDLDRLEDFELDMVVKIQTSPTSVLRGYALDLAKRGGKP